MLSSVLEAVRVSRGLTQTALSAAAGISQGMLSLIETGHQVPSAAASTSLGRALEVQPELFELTVPEVRLLHTFRDAVSAKALKRVMAEFALAFLRIELLVPGTRSALPRLGAHPPTAGAGELRDDWAMAHGPVHDIVAVLEEGGVLCLHRHLDGPRVSALAATSDAGHSLIFIDPRTDADAGTWAVAHELGHLMSPASTDEAAADEFAGEFLAPHSDIHALLRDKPDEDTLHELFRMPAPAFAAHARRGGLISTPQYRRLRTWPPSFTGDELTAPSRIAAAVRQRLDAGEQLAHVADAAFLSEDELRRDYMRH